MPARVFRVADESILIRLSGRETIRIGARNMPAVESLLSGVSRTEWLRRVVDEPAIAHLDMVLSDHDLIEVVSFPRADAPKILLVQEASGDGVASAVCLVLLAWAGIVVCYLRRIEAGDIAPMPWWAWPLACLPVVSVALAHEASHALVARLYGQHATIKLWENGTFLPRCRLTTNSHFTSRRHVLLLAAGPLSDSFILGLSSLAIVRGVSSESSQAILSLFACCSMLGLLANLSPHANSDFGKMLSMAAPKSLQASIRTAGWIYVSILAAVATPVMMTMLFGNVSTHQGMP